MAVDPSLPPFVLVHGGRHGGWAWRPVATRLKISGFDVYTPTFTGLGERSHLLNRDIGLDTHTEDIVNLFNFEDLRDVVIVAHSYGGMPVSAAMERIFDRVRHTVYLDANLPISGESVFDIIGPEREAKMLEMVTNEGEGWFVPISDSKWWDLTDQDQIDWINSKISPQPVKTYMDHIGTVERVWGQPGTYIECNPTRASERVLKRVRQRALSDTKFRHLHLNTGHEAMVTAPDELTELLIEAANMA